MEYEPVIGLEVHAQLLTESKIFCKCSTRFGGEQNKQVCPICLGMPGVLPVINQKAVDFAIRIGLATQCEISFHSIMARKNYFYPDLPKGYQISQYEEPLCKNGHVEIEINGELKKIRLIRIHLEEDAGKSVHAEEYVEQNETLIDLNRCGVPLIEIVSQPDIASPHEAYLYLNQLRQILQYLGICDGNMEEGSLRCDGNVSIKPVGETKLSVSTELKNMNTFHGLEKALEYEIQRQQKIVEGGGHVVKETLLWDSSRNVAISMRAKEMAHDYRYFPEPDLVPLEVGPEWIKKIQSLLPEMPMQRKKRFMTEYNLPAYDAEVLTDTKSLADYYEACLKYTSDTKGLSNWVMSDVLRVLKDKKIEIHEFPVRPKNLADLVNLINDATISSRIAKNVFDRMIETGEEPEIIVQESGLTQLSDTVQIEAMVEQVLQRNPDEVEKYLSGKAKLMSFFVGQVMRLSKGKANPEIVNNILKQKFEKLGTK